MLVGATGVGPLPTRVSAAPQWLSSCNGFLASEVPNALSIILFSAGQEVESP